MTRAKDISKILTDANISGTLDVSGAFTSLGIDDNADATAITIDSSERVGIGVTSLTQKLEVAGKGVFSTANPDVNGLKITATTATNAAAMQFSNTSNAYIGLDNSSGGRLGSSAYGLAIYQGGAYPIVLHTNASERMRIDGSSGYIGIGDSGPTHRLVISGNADSTNSQLKVTATGVASGGYGLNSDGMHFGCDLGSGSITFRTGTTGGGSFTNTGTERVRISSGGRVGINNTNPNSAMLHADQTASNEQGIFIHPEHTSFTNIGLLVQTIRGQDASFALIQCKTNSGGDLEFNLRGDGSAYADLNWNGGGADYAEYFEWKDGNTDNEDRRGYTVVLDGNQIRKSTSDDAPSTIIGVVSATPVVVGDNAWNMWNGKYEKDEYGNYIFEEHTVTEWKDGNKTKSYHTDKIPSDVTVPDDAIVKTYHVDENDKSTSEKFSRRKESSSYDASKTYISREDRNEWDTIGLVGKLRIRVGQTIGDRWIKMREISDTVHEYLVR